MAITKIVFDYKLSADKFPRQDFFVNRVLAIETAVESRNFSDTFDYTDFRSVNCTYALVWLGEYGTPAKLDHRMRMIAQIDDNRGEARKLEFHEQFAWVDCTNLFADRCGFSLKPTVDGEFGTFGEPKMWANCLAWKTYQDSLARSRAEKAKLDKQAATLQKKLAKQKAQAKQIAQQNALENSRINAEELLKKLPKKGSHVKLPNFEGKIFWSGMNKNFGSWRARVGLVNAQGIRQFFSAQHVLNSMV